MTTTIAYKKRKKSSSIVPFEIIEQHILFIRGQKVLLSNHLAELYQVKHKVLMQSVRRNLKRFPDDFMFQLSPAEFKNLKSQFVTSSWGGIRKQPYAFTEHGVAMLSSILNSDRAIQVNIEIMRTFTRLRNLLLTNKELAEKLKELEKKYDEQFKVVFEALRQLLTPPEKPKHPFGFTIEEPRIPYQKKYRQ
ncbi:MAG: ORF6N domain-containing protein [Bacteroidota bacterium]